MSNEATPGSGPKNPDERDNDDANKDKKQRDEEGNFAQNEDELADEWGEDSFPTSDPPSNY